MVDVEVLSPGHDREDGPEPRVKVTHVRALGLFGTALAILTMFAAVGVGFMALFGTTVLAALLAKLLWPLIFSVEFTKFVFGSEIVPFWKLFVLFLAAGAVMKAFRRLSGGR